jgi:hypothetical protein
MTKQKTYRWLSAGGVLIILALIFARDPRGFPGANYIINELTGKASVSDRQAEYGPAVRERWRPYFQRAGVEYPPQRLVLVGLKQERQLEVYAAGEGQSLKLLRSFTVLGLSGKSGPKLRFGDMQVPEGFYGIESLNPNSAFHLALRVSYPNEADRAQAAKEGRTDLGGDIMIHGSNGSIGCLAMGDEVAEDLFILASEIGPSHIEVILSPVDFRTTQVRPDANRPKWVQKLYAKLAVALKQLQA